MDHLLDEVYEAAVVPELWAPLLHKISIETASAGGVLFTANVENDVKWIASDGLNTLVSDFIADGWMQRNSRPARCMELQLMGFISDYDLFSSEEMDRDPLYGYLRSKGFGWCSGMLAPLPTGDVVVVNFERHYRRGAFEDSHVLRLNEIRPHLARSALMAHRIGLERAQATTAALNMLNLPAGVVKKGRLYAANQLLQSYVPEIISDLTLGIRLTNRITDQIFQTAMSGAALRSHHVFSIPLVATEDRDPAILHLLPLKGAGRDIFWSADMLLLVTPVHRGNVPSGTVLQGLFDFTPAEANVARGIASGLTLDHLATQLGVRKSTLRVQLKAVFEKCGVNRQADLVGLLAGQII